MSTTDTDFDPLTALTDLVQSDGWKLFVAQANSEYGPVAYARGIDQIITGARGKNESPEIDLCALGAVVRKVQALLRWPDEQIGKLKAEKEQKPDGWAWRRRA